MLDVFIGLSHSSLQKAFQYNWKLKPIASWMLHSRDSELYEKAERREMVGEGKRFSYIFADLALYHSREAR